jgi:four helix bundle protein
MKYAFECLEVWQKSKGLVVSVYKLTSSYPSEEKFGLVSQLRRAAISVSSNIAEGSTRWSRQDQARFYEISYSSLMEVLNQLILSKELGFITEEQTDNLKVELDTVSRMLNALYQSTKKP